MDPQQQRQLQDLLLTMAMQSPGEQTQLLDELARKDPELAAQVSLRLGTPSPVTDTQPLRSPTGLPARFETTRRLGQGAFGTVYEAYDREQGRTVAVKVLRQAQPESLFRFKQEFRVLANLRHTNLVEFYELFEYDQLWFFTMELVRGEAFLRYVRPGGLCDLERLAHCLRDLTRVLSWLHENEVLHRDIKPDNTIIENSGRFVLLDFGLARHLAPNAQSGTMTVGTPAYMAPEQISDASVTYAADWYAVGGLMYHALTGKIPFEGTILQVLDAKASRDPVPPSTLASGIPPEWDAMCCRLLDRTPGRRPDGMELLAWLERSELPAPPRPSKARTFVGRQDVLERMLEACQTAVKGHAAVIEVVGPSGFGKSSLIQAFAQRAAARYPQAFVIRGRCYEHESVPFKALDALIDDLSRQLQGMESELAEVLPKDIAALAQVFPVLERVNAIAEAAERNPVRIMNASERRRRALVAFAALLDSLSTRHLLILCLDDLQWGDADSAAFFQHLFATAAVPPLVLIMTYRSSDAGGDFLRLLREQVIAAGTRLARMTENIGPLDSQAATELARELLERHGLNGDDPAELASESGGNPLLLEQLAADLASSTTRESSRRAGVAGLVQARIARLSNAARQFLEMLAAVGEPLPESVAVRLVPAGPGESEVMRSTVVSSLLSQNFVRRRESAGVRELEIHHDQIRVAIIENVQEPERKAIHLRIAAALVSVAYDDDGMIAVQFARGGDEVRAAEYAVRAASAAEAVLAFDRAAQFLALALALGSPQGTEAASLYERLARSYAAGGRGSDAARAYEKAAGFAAQREWRLELLRHAAEEWIRSGNVRQGLTLLVSLGGEFGVRHTDSLTVAMCSIIWSRAALAVRGLRYRERRAEELAPRDLAHLDVCWALTAGLSLWNPVIGARFQLRHLRLALRAGEPRRIGVALATEAGYRCLSGERAYPAARSLIGQSLAIGSRVEDPRIIGTAHAMGGMCGWLTGRWGEARDFGLEGERVLRENCAGASWELSVARNSALGGLIWSGEWRRYSERLAEWTRDAQERGDMNSLSVYRMNQCPLSLAMDDPEQATLDLDEAERILATAWSARGFHIPHFFGLFGRVQVAMYRQRAAVEFDLIETRLKKLRRSSLLRIETLAIMALILEATLSIAAAGEHSEAAERTRLLAKAAGYAEALRRKHAVWSLGHAMLIEAGIEASFGRREQACARWFDAQRELERSGMLMYAAAARYSRGHAGGDRESIESAEGFFREHGVKSPDRISAVLAPGLERQGSSVVA